MLRQLQKLGKAMQLPVAVLPICGILMGLGYALAPGVMGVPDAPTSGIAYLVGFFLIKAGGAVIDNMPILFAVSVGVGLSQEGDGVGGIAGLVSWLMMTSLLNPAVVVNIVPSMCAAGSVNEVAFSKIANPFIGILAGVIGSICYNKFKNTKLPDFLAFFSGKRCVAIITGVVSILVSVVLLFAWPVVFSALVSLGKGILKLDVVGVGIYTFLNRLLISFGLHHALNNVFWFDTIGIGDLTAYWAGLTEGGVMANGNTVNWSVGMYMSGFFPFMMFGVLGGALAIVKNAKTDKRKVTMGIMLSAALSAFMCGVTEPFEFAFMFLAFPLYIVYALLCGIFASVTVALGFRAGFCFSAGATDLIFSSFLPAANKTWLIIPLGIAAFVIFFLVFNFAIQKWDLKTPGREDDQESETRIELANNDYTAMAKIILEGLGGKENLASLDYCITRVRTEVKDPLLVNEGKIKSSGAAGIFRPNKTIVQVIIGPKVQFVYDEIKKMV